MTGFKSKKAAALDKLDDDDTQVYQRPWVGLTNDERYDCVHSGAEDSWDVALLIEAKLKDKNT